MGKRVIAKYDDSNKRNKTSKRTNELSRIAQLHQNMLSGPSESASDDVTSDDDGSFNICVPIDDDTTSVTSLHSTLDSDDFNPPAIMDIDEYLTDDDCSETSSTDSMTDGIPDNNQAFPTLHEIHHQAAPLGIPPLDPQFSSNDLCMIELIELCMRAGTSIKFVDDLLKLLRKHTKLGFDILKTPKRANFMRRLRTLVPHPRTYHVTTSSGLAVHKFDFLAQVKDLLSSDIFQSLDKCTVNADPSIRFHQYISPEYEGYSEVANGQWYKTTHNQKVGVENTFYHHPETNQTYTNWLVPLIFYVDKTGVGAMEGAYTLEPLMFTFGIIRLTERERNDAWRHLGFIPKYSRPNASSTANLRCYHECVSKLLHDVKAMQDDPPLLTLNLFGEIACVRPIFEVAFVIGDQESQDKHTGRKACNGGGSGRIHRSCMASYLSSDTFSSHNACNLLNKKTVEDLSRISLDGTLKDRRADIVDKTYPSIANQAGSRVAIRENNKIREQFDKFLQLRGSVATDILGRTYTMHPIDNAWNDVSFGSNPNGIYRASLDDPMHYHCSGLLTYVLEVAFGHLKPTEAASVENLLRKQHSMRSSRRYDFPRGKFSDGFSNCTLITSSERVGLIHGRVCHKLDDCSLAMYRTVVCVVSDGSFEFIRHCLNDLLFI